MKTIGKRTERLNETRRRLIATRVRTALVPHQPRRYRLLVESDTIELRGADWLVVVRPDRAGTPLGDSVTRMMAAEDTLRRRWKMNVSLLPAMPPEDD